MSSKRADAKDMEADDDSIEDEHVIRPNFPPVSASKSKSVSKNDY